jgi:hypothetical protein
VRPTEAWLAVRDELEHMVEKTGAIYRIGIGGLAFLCLGLASCSIPIELDRADIVRDERGAVFQGRHVPVIYNINVHLSRHAVQRIVNNQLYIYIHVVDCETHVVMAAVYPKLGDNPMHDFGRIDSVLRSTTQNSFMISGQFSPREAIGLHNACVTLDGGGYLFQKVTAPFIRAGLRGTVTAARPKLAVTVG